jgi:hypothetical protein
MLGDAKKAPLAGQSQSKWKRLPLLHSVHRAEEKGKK